MTSLLATPKRSKSRGPAGPVAIAPAVWLAAPIFERQPIEPANPAHWLYEQTQYHRRYRDGASQICDVGICDLYLTVNRCGFASVVANPGLCYAGLELLNLDMPRPERRSRLADVLDEQVTAYLEMGSAVARLAARVILWYAEGAEYHTAQSAAEYWAREESWREQEHTAVLSGYDRS